MVALLRSADGCFVEEHAHVIRRAARIFSLSPPLDMPVFPTIPKMFKRCFKRLLDRAWIDQQMLNECAKIIRSLVTNGVLGAPQVAP